MKPRELSLEECIGLLSDSKYGRLGLCSQNAPYVIPMSYVYAQGKIFLHSRQGGRKVEIATANPKVCFQVDNLEKGRWRSVVVTGKAVLDCTPESKEKMFHAFMGRGAGGHGGKAFKREDLSGMEMTIWVIEVDEITGREGIW